LLVAIKPALLGKFSAALVNKLIIIPHRMFGFS